MEDYKLRTNDVANYYIEVIASTYKISKAEAKQAFLQALQSNVVYEEIDKEVAYLMGEDVDDY